MTGAREKLAAFIAAHREDFLRGLREKVATMESLWDGALRGEDPQAKLQELHRLAHSLNGTAPTFGFAETGAAARELEAAVKPLVSDAVPAVEVRASVAALLVRLRATLPAS